MQSGAITQQQNSFLLKGVNVTDRTDEAACSPGRVRAACGRQELVNPERNGQPGLVCPGKGDGLSDCCPRMLCYSSGEVSCVCQCKYVFSMVHLVQTQYRRRLQTRAVSRSVSRFYGPQRSLGCPLGLGLRHCSEKLEK